MEFTREEIDSFGIDALEWKSYIHVEIDGVDKWFQPAGRPKREPAVLVAFGGFFVVLSVIGFFWMCWKMTLHSYEFFLEQDVGSRSGQAIIGGCALLLITTLYYVFYPEGQNASDAVALRNRAADGSVQLTGVNT